MKPTIRKTIMNYWYLFITFNFLNGFVNSQTPNVCETYLDYSTRKNCIYNPDVDSDTDVISMRYGYPIERHQVITDDGYILTVFRLSNDSYDSQPVFMQHGISTDSTVWVAARNKSLAFALFDKGYDVWMGNIRGNWYSNRHVNESIGSDYWDYTLDELGKYDIAAQLNLIKSHSQQKRSKGIIYIGHSMGTTLGYIYSIARNKEATDNVCGFIHLAPVMYLDHTFFGQPENKAIKNVLENTLGAHGFPLTPGRSASQYLFKQLCFQHASTAKLCNEVINSLFGSNPPQREPIDLPALYSGLLSGISSKTFAHFLQFTNQRFNHYDYKVDNIKRYGTKISPPYDIKQINNRFLLLYGPNDALSKEKDIINFRAKLSDPNMFVMEKIDNFSHTDFLFAKDINLLLFPKIFSYMESIRDKYCV